MHVKHEFNGRTYPFKTILLIGSGPIVIGQACEFDYSGTQSIKTLKSLNFRVVLINSNPATIMTDPELADATYIEPISEENIKAIIDTECVDAILPTMGGQTALNVTLKMHEKGLLEGVQILGANIEAIKKGEDRKLFKECMQKIGLDVAKSFYAYNFSQATSVLEHINFPLIVRASFTLGGGGSGVAYNIKEYEKIVEEALLSSPISEILIEESMLGWKEYEMEVIRDKDDNCIIVCSIENFDPMGVHTGDSITIAPALSLTDKEYQRMRDASFAILREIGVDTGGSNVQFAIRPSDGRMVVIEMNPRVSRSSALASKATGYPIAKVATLLAIGFRLDEIINDITHTTAAFEPSIDYIVTKMPRFTFEKFKEADSTLTTSMKSIGEVMAIGANFTQSFQKAIYSLESSLCGFEPVSCDVETIKQELIRPNEKRFLYIADAFRAGLSVDEVHELCKIDRFFLNKIFEITSFESEIDGAFLESKDRMLEAKKMGFSDARIAQILKIDESRVAKARDALEVSPDYERVDTCAGEFESLTNYLYSSYYPRFITAPSRDDNVASSPKVMIIGSGPNRIGQGIEFDYCCVHASFALRDLGVKSIMHNCNPETVSTDYDISDVLYFEPITLESTLAILKRESPDGVIVHFGGQTPLKLAQAISQAGYKVIGTQPETIDVAEDRDKFANFASSCGIIQPKNGIAYSANEAIKIAEEICYPVLVRPSYVLGGRAMRIVDSKDELLSYMREALSASEGCVLIDKFLNGAIELDVDCISDGESIFIGGIMQHIEEAGIHSGDSTSSLPTMSLDSKMLENIKVSTARLAIKLGVIGLMNAQFAIHDGVLYLLEVNPRASRSVPFVSKAVGMPMAKVATRVMYQGDLREALEFYGKYASFKATQEVAIDHEIKCVVYEPVSKSGAPYSHIALKASVFPFNKLSGADLLLGPEMKSTGEVMGISYSFGESFAKTQEMIKNTLPQGGRVFLSLCDEDKIHAKEIAQGLLELGFEILATQGTFKAIYQLEAERICKALKLHEGRPNIKDELTNKKVHLVINTSDNKPSKTDAKIIRTEVIRNQVPYLSTITGARAAILALKTTHRAAPKSLQAYLKA